MAAVAEEPTATTTTTEHIRFRRPRNQSITPSDPNPQNSPLLQSTRCKPTISSLFLSTFTNNNNGSNDSSSALKNKKKNFSSATFRGLGCATSSQVSAPSIIRSSADWQAKKVRKKKQRNPHKKKNNNNNQQTMINNPTPVVVPDVWCAPGIAFASDAAASVDCVVSRRPVQGRGRVDGGERVNHKERSCVARRTANFEHITVLDSPPAFETMRSGSDVFGARHHRHFRHHSPAGLAEIMMFQTSLILGGRSDGHDRYRDWRLNVDNMTYEELLELGDRIGYVNTGLREEEILRCLRKTKPAVSDNLSSNFLTEIEWKCSICQEEYEADDDLGKLDCGHSYHVYCVKQWLLQKNACPVCKVAVAAQY